MKKTKPDKDNVILFFIFQSSIFLAGAEISMTLLLVWYMIKYFLKFLPSFMKENLFDFVQYIFEGNNKIVLAIFLFSLFFVINFWILKKIYKKMREKNNTNTQFTFASIGLISILATVSLVRIVGVLLK
ncbi:hypothetical protein AAEX28_15135 [Lentisphaerota bacterium WC36G]|nr:hypothetical protein LJT99_01890 [Lentisphaerae bacterium WC36]